MAKKQKLTPMQQLLINNGGPFGHRLRRAQRMNAIPKTPKARKTRADKQEAR